MTELWDKQKPLVAKQAEQHYLHILMAQYPDKAQAADVAGCSLIILYRKLEIPSC